MKDIDLIVWDLDGTKYRFPSNITAIASDVLVPIIQERLVSHGYPTLSAEEIIELGKQSQAERGVSWLYFSEKYEFDWRELYLEFNDQMPIETVTANSSPLYKDLIRKTKDAGIEHIIFTHGSRAWALRVLERIGLAEEFDSDKIFDLTTTDCSFKHHGRDAYEALFRQIPSYSPSRSMMVEDSVVNLLPAKQIGMQTTLIDYSDSQNPQSGHVDYTFNTPQDFLHNVLNSRIVQNFEARQTSGEKILT